MQIRIVAIAVLVLSMGCDAATGSVKGGDPVLCPPGNGGSTWTDLYADYFGPCGSASCSGQSECHLDANSAGTKLSGFACGVTQESCWEGIAVGIPLDAGGGFPPIVTGALVSALHKSQPTGLDQNNMPCGEAAEFACPPATSPYAFTPADLARISSWIQQGAQDN
jgi:hypothetical protein